MTSPLLERALGRFGARGGVLSNTSWQVGDRVFRLAVGFAVSVWVVRYLGPESFGRLSYALAFASLFSPLANLGLDPIVVRELVSRPESRNEILGSAFVLRSLGGLAAIAVSLGALLFIPHDSTTFSLVAISALTLLPQAFDVIEHWFQSKLEVSRAVLARNAALLVTSILRVAFVLAAFSVVAFAWAGLIEAALAGLALVVAFAWRGESISRWRFVPARARALVADSWPFIFSNAMIMIYMRIDQLMLGRMIGVKELGVYSVAVKLTEVWYVLPMAVVSSVFPSVVRARDQGDEVFDSKLQRLYNAMALAGYAVAIPVVLLAGPVVGLAFGEAYRGATPMLQILIWTVLFTNLGVARSSYLTAMNWARLHLATVAIGALANVALNFVLIPRYGGVGAAVATVAAQALAAYLSCFLIPRLRKTGSMLTRSLVYPRAW